MKFRELDTNSVMYATRVNQPASLATSAKSSTPPTTTTVQRLQPPPEVGDHEESTSSSSAAAATTKQVASKLRPSSSPLSDYLIKLSMFLVASALVCAPPPIYCQKHLFQHHHHNHLQQQQQQQQYPQQQQQLRSPALKFHHFSHHQSLHKNHIHQHQQQQASSQQHILLDQRQALDHLMQNQHHFHALNQHQIVSADRRASPAATSATPSGAADQPAAGDGKLLVCYYTTRQAAPAAYWPATGESARSLAPPPPPPLPAREVAAAEVRQESGFAPMLQYEPFVGGQQQQQQQQQQGADSGVKNQQQQLVFKSAPVLQPATALSAVTYGTWPSSQQQQHFPRQAGRPTPTYSFVDFEPQQASGNGQQQQLIVGASDGSTTSGVIQVSPPPSPSSQLPTGNNGFAMNSKDATSGSNNNGQQPRSLPSNKQQQLVFSPPASLSRAFIVGGSVGVTASSGSGSESAASNNELLLDTKSQLFIPSGQQQQQVNPNNYYMQQQQQQQQQVEMAAPARGKSLQVGVASGEQLSPVAVAASASASQPSHGAFSGPVSSSPPVPLSPASSPTQSAANSQHHHQQSASFQPQQPQQQATHLVAYQRGGSGNSLPLQQMQPFLPSNNPQQQLIVSSPNLQQQQQQQQQQVANAARGHTQSTSGGGGANSSTGLSAAAAPQKPSSAPDVSLGKSVAATGGTQPLLHHLPNPQPSVVAAAAPSSPLSTMFDVFGAASQYLMRFKPSSLISPSSFVFNALTQTGSQSDGKQTTSGNSSFASSLIPLPFGPSSSTSNLLGGQKSSTNGGPASDRSGSGGGILSRFSLAQGGANQRREDVCGRTIQTPQRRIIGGEGARYGEFPYQVHIKIAKHQCGGALVDKQSIVTAAHCVYHFITRAPVSKLQIVIGAYDIEDEQYQELPPQYFKVNKVKLHPNFRFSASHPDRYDIAILKLDKPVKYTDNVLPVCLPSKDLKFESMVGTVTGFGKTDPSLSNRYGTRLLQKVDVPIIENNECERWHRTRGIDLKIFPEMMCAGYEDGLKDACVGDSGGPLVVKTAASSTTSGGQTSGGGGARWTLAGITSAGFGCAQSRQPGIYHRVSHTVDWILENLD